MRRRGVGARKVFLKRHPIRGLLERAIRQDVLLVNPQPRL